MVRALMVLLLVVVMLAPIAPPARAGAPTGPAAGVTSTRGLGAGSRIPWQGKDWYLNGANVPWLNWARDFGGGVQDGNSNPDNRAKLSARFGEAKANGANVLRWWTFEGDPWQVKRDDAGAPTGLDEAIYADFDTALEIAEEHDLYYVFVLFAAPSQLPRAWLDDTGQRKQLAAALEPLFARYKDNQRIMTWEVFNEPEFDVWNKKTNDESMRSTVREIASAVHANSNAYVTVGGAMLDGIPMLKGLGLDYYQAHWYDYMEAGDWCALCQNYETIRAKYDLDGPLVIGEIVASSEVVNPHLRLDDFYTKGYAGAWPWSIFSEITNDKISIDWNSMRIFAGRRSDLGPRTTAALAPADAAPTVRLSFSSKAQTEVSRVAPGGKLPIDVKVTATAGVKALVDVEIYTMSGDKVYQQAYDNQSFGPGETKVYSTVWAVPADAATGEYVIKVGVFTPGWGKVQDWNESAAKFTVAR